MSARPLHFSLATLLLVASSAEAAPKTRQLVYKATPVHDYEIVDEDRVVRTGPRTERHVYETRKVLRRQVREALDQEKPPKDLEVGLLMLSSVMRLDGTVIPADLGGRRDYDRMRPNGHPLHLGALEDPARLSAPFPDEPVKVGESWLHSDPPTDKYPAETTHKITFMGEEKVGGVPALRLEVESRREGKDEKQGLSIASKETQVVHLDPSDLSVIQLTSKTKSVEVYGARKSQQTVTRNKQRTVKRRPLEPVATAEPKEPRKPR